MLAAARILLSGLQIKSDSLTLDSHKTQILLRGDIKRIEDQISQGKLNLTKRIEDEILSRENRQNIIEIIKEKS